VFLITTFQTGRSGHPGSAGDSPLDSCLVVLQGAFSRPRFRVEGLVDATAGTHRNPAGARFRWVLGVGLAQDHRGRFTGDRRAC
jgi:hypothetical protein